MFTHYKCYQLPQYVNFYDINKKRREKPRDQDKNPEMPIFSQRKEIEGPENQKLERDHKGFDNVSKKLKEAKQASAVHMLLGT